MRIILVIIFMIISIGCQRTGPRNIRDYHEPTTQTPIEQLTPAQQVLRKLTTQGHFVQTFYANVETIARKRAFAQTSQGHFVYRAPRSFRMVNKGVVDGRLNSDMGANEQGFWFYVRRIDPTTMYYCDWDRSANNANLPKSINPKFIIEGLGFGADYAGARSELQGNNLLVLQQSGNMTATTVFDATRPAFSAMYLQTGEKVISKSVVQNYSFLGGIYIPSQVEAAVYEENVHITWKLSGQKINIAVNANEFVMPNLRMKIVDIGRQSVDFNDKGE